MNFPEQYKIDHHGFDAYRIPNGYGGHACNAESLLVLASIDKGWEHVSVSSSNGIPTWGEMCKVRKLFWEDEELVIQFHPKKSEYVNLHPNCLHLWRGPAEIMRLLENLE